MNTATLRNSLRLFEELGSITARSMFGGFGIFSDGTIFALVVKDVLHIRATTQTLDYFTSMGFQPYSYQKRGSTTVTRYFALPEILWEDPLEILSIGTVALKHAKIEQELKAAEAEQANARIKDLPNLTSTSERMLKKAGIESVDQLQELGAATAFNEVQKVHPNTISHNFLLSLEGALEGTHWSRVPKQRQEELLHQVNRPHNSQSLN